jgi:hypothetical protein
LKSPRSNVTVARPSDASGCAPYALMPANVNHFAFTKAEATILLYGTGPVDFKYVNPADDPRNYK